MWWRVKRWETDDLEKYSDIVVIIYRDEYYDPDTVDRGIAEIIVSKHKNGPLGTVKMLFEPEYGRYRNLAAWYLILNWRTYLILFK